VVQTFHEDGGGSINGLRFSSKGDLFASAHGPSAEDNIIRVWSTRTGAVLKDIADSTSEAANVLNAALEFTPDGSSLIRVQPGGWYMNGPKKVFIDSFFVYDTQAWQATWSLRTDPFRPQALGLSPDGRSAAVAGQEPVLEKTPPIRQQPKILLVDLADRRIRLTANILSLDCWLEFVVWSPDGRRIAVGGNAVGQANRVPGVQILDSSTGEVLESIPARSNLVALDYSADGKYLLVGWGNDGIQIWDAAHTKLMQRISGDHGAARFSWDGHHLAIATRRSVAIWDMK
jgi:WD40 repeat protein